MKDRIIEQYIQLKLSDSAALKNVYLFAKELEIAEKEFYEHYSSLEALEADIFNQWFIGVKQNLEKSELYDGYSTREKILALNFAWIEALQANRSFVKEVWKYKKDMLSLPKMPSFLKPLKESFEAFADSIINEGIQNNELVDRKFLSDKYKNGLWLNLLFVVNFWLNDHSKAFEKTDAAIEKSVNLAFDLMGKSPLDSMFDFGKFVFQNK
ncbi:MAG: TetR family transcriptional regulator C-terminal domain-containing protein [bacterium]|nr:TetR family transcriptional regulator C-terminal domain-containing protein [bacterium]